MNCISEIKLITLGNSHVGKTSFINRYTENTFSIHIPSTIGIDNKYKIEKLDNNEKIKVTIFDTNGQERFRSISYNMLKNANGVLLFFDVTSRDSFDSIKEWMNNIYNFKDEKFPIVLIGNKIDKNKDERQVLKEEGESEAEKYKIKYFETSCKMDINIKETILYLLSIINKTDDHNDSIKIKPMKKKRIKCCHKNTLN